MKIIIDDKIPFIRGVFEPYAEVNYFGGSAIGSEHVSDADALIVRTRTRCDEHLLRGTKVKFVGTATIGFDHIDTQWCEENSVVWTNAPGCNADSVEQYISAALLHWAEENAKKLSDLCIGVVGVGHVGSRVARSCKLLGMKVLLNDPPRERLEGSNDFHDLETICEMADIISFHVPLNYSGVDKTVHLVNAELLSKLKPGTLIVNSCRGEVFDTESVIKAIENMQIVPPIIDCWENEPKVNSKLLERTFLATPHIAGYSSDGKANGTAMIVRALARHFDLPLTDWIPDEIPVPKESVIRIHPDQKSEQTIFAEAVLKTYPIWQDDKRFRENPSLFEEQRGSYPLRREYHAFTIDKGELDQEIIHKFRKMKFKI
jgi:erythronate-4-phosphate dehydrogenase